MDPALASEIEAIVNETVRAALGDLIPSIAGTSAGGTYPNLGAIDGADIMALALKRTSETGATITQNMK